MTIDQDFELLKQAMGHKLSVIGRAEMRAALDRIETELNRQKDGFDTLSRELEEAQAGHELAEKERLRASM